MIKNVFKNFLVITLAALMLIAPTSVIAADGTGGRLVLMPLKGEELTQLEFLIYRSSLAEALSKKYEVLSGREVDEKIVELFGLESIDSIYCDTDKCLQEIGAAFKTDLIASAMILPKGETYFLQFEIINALDNKVVYTSSESCDKCDETKIISLLKFMTGVEEISAEPDKVTKKKKKWWLWALLGMVVLGGVAAAFNRGGGDDGSDNASKDTGTVVIDY